jgi:hypothetical protein
MPLSADGHFSADVLEDDLAGDGVDAHIAADRPDVPRTAVVDVEGADVLHARLFVRQRATNGF